MKVELDPQLAELLRQAAAAGLPAVELQSPEEARAGYVSLAAAQFGTVAEMQSVEDRGADGVPIRVYRPLEPSGTNAALIYYHGGGWVIGSVETHDGVTRALAARTGCVVVSVDYRLAPEHPYPAAVDDSWTAARWVLAQAAELGIDPARVGVAGDSAGGTLAAIVARKGRDAGTPFAAQLLLYPVASPRTDSESWSLFGTGYGLTREAMLWYWRLYLDRVAMEDALDDPDISLLAPGSLAGLPPALVVTAEADILRDDGEAYAARLAAAGVATETCRWPGMNHGFVRMGGVVDRARSALDEIAGRFGPLVSG
jgi:acetyl esterase